METSGQKERVVYFAEDVETGAIKIGFSKNVQQRLQQLGALRRAEVRLLAAFPEEQVSEFSLHEFFEKHRIQSGGREWYKPDEVILAMIDQLRAGEQVEGLREYEGRSPFQCYLPWSMKEALQQEALATNRSMVQVVIAAVREYLSDPENTP